MTSRKTPGHPVHDLIASKVGEWQALRESLAAIAAREHPDITDRFGRVWVWRDGDLYSHDATLAVPRCFLDHPGLGLPRAECADNPNYARLCSLCRADWPQAQLELFQVRWARDKKGEVTGRPLA